MFKNIPFWERLLALTALNTRKNASTMISGNKTFSYGILVKISSNLLFILAFGLLIYFGIRGGRRALEVFSITAANWFFLMGISFIISIQKIHFVLFLCQLNHCSLIGLNCWFELFFLKDSYQYYFLQHT